MPEVTTPVPMAPVSIGLRYGGLTRSSTNSDLPVDADVIHRKHSIVETVFADLIDGPPAHGPSGRFRREHCLGTAALAHTL